MSQQETLIKSELKSLLENHTSAREGTHPISTQFLDGITTIVDAIEVASLEDLDISFHNTSENFYIEFMPTNNYLSCHQLENLFYSSFEMPKVNEKKWKKFGDRIDCNPYKLHIGPGGLKLEVENNYDRIKLFRFIIPLQ